MFKRIANIFCKQPKTKTNKQEIEKYSFCEKIRATGISPWHIRELTSVGKKLGGGADTKSLCGEEVSWDLVTKVDSRDFNFDHICKECIKEYTHKNQLPKAKYPGVSLPPRNEETL